MTSMSVRRTVTVLFTDLVDSTQLMLSMPTEGAEHLRSRHFQQMRNALTVHRGREVKTIGDAVMASFDAAGDALGCAVTMQRAVERDARESGQPVSLRVGISSGDVSEDGGDFFGVAVVEASRLVGIADGGEILVNDLVLKIAGDHGRQAEQLGLTELKGLGGPIEVSRIPWEDLDDESLRVALVDDSVLLRQGIAKTLKEEGVVIVFEASDAEDLDAKLEATRPHVVVLDVRMPPTFTTEGLKAARQIKAERPGVGVLVLSAEVEPVAARQLLNAATEGVGYLLKDRVADIDELMESIRTIARGGCVIDPAIVEMIG